MKITVENFEHHLFPELTKMAADDGSAIVVAG
jgi:hypothetical protein